MHIYSTLATVVLALWCGAGLFYTVERLAGPIGLWIERPAGMEGAIGMPLPGAADVTQITELLAATEAREESPLVVVYPPGTDPYLLGYVSEQLAHLRYPQRVTVKDARENWAWGDYRVAVTAAGLRVRGLIPSAERDGFALYLRSGQ